ncbi:hypothetical protein GGI17_002369 [Coemansia sp. S146]|nr:hypothetical protein GGI17_002369 [Coemansia sp. S146]
MSREDPSGPVFKVNLRAVVTRFGAWARKIPNAGVLHGLGSLGDFPRSSRAVTGRQRARWFGYVSPLEIDSHRSYSARLLQSYFLAKASHIFQESLLVSGV